MPILPLEWEHGGTHRPAGLDCLPVSSLLATNHPPVTARVALQNISQFMSFTPNNLPAAPMELRRKTAPHQGSQILRTHHHPLLL